MGVGAVSRWPDPEICARWRLTPGPVLSDRATGTFAASRDGSPFVVKHFGPAALPDWRYPLRVAAALRELGWPTPEPAAEPLVRPDGAWVLFHRLPGRSVLPTEAQRPAEERARGRLLAELHASAMATGITDGRGWPVDPAHVVSDPGLEHWLRVHEKASPIDGRLLRACRDAAAQWFTDHPTADAPRSVIHGDFTPWNLLFDDDRLTGVIDFEMSHHTFQVTDFALSWRGYHDDVIRGYDEVRPLSDLEWQLIRPAYWAWLFIGLRDELAAQYRDGGAAPLTLEWTMQHLRKHSPLLADRSHVPVPPG